jgi:excisionase family DNA binding protein
MPDGSFCGRRCGIVSLQSPAVTNQVTDSWSGPLPAETWHRIIPSCNARVQQARAYGVRRRGSLAARNVPEDGALMPARDDRPPGETTPRDPTLAEMRFLTVAEVAQLMRVSRMTVYRLVHSGEMPAVRVGRSFRVPERAVHEYLRTAFNDVG